MLKFILIFSVVQIVNVILSTIKSILTANGGKISASISNAVYFAFYTFVLVYTADTTIGETWVKALITAITNLVGVYIAKLILEKFEKEKLWEIVATVPKESHFQEMHYNLNTYNIGNNYIVLDNGDAIFHIYSKNREESKIVKKEIECFDAKYVIHEASVKL